MRPDLVRQDRVVALLALVLAGCGGADDVGWHDTFRPAVDDVGWYPSGPGVEGGWARTCLVGPEGQRSTWSEPDHTLVGTVAGLELPEGALAEAGCSRDQEVVLEIVDDDGARWFLGWTLLDAKGAEVTPPLDLVAGAPVRLKYHVVNGFSVSEAFVLQDHAGLVVAVDVNAGQIAGAVPGLQVRAGDVTERAVGGCGREVEHALVFEGDDEVVVAPFGQAHLTLAGQPLTAIAATAYLIEDSSCTDVGGAEVWAVHR